MQQWGRSFQPPFPRHRGVVQDTLFLHHVKGAFHQYFPLPHGGSDFLLRKGAFLSQDCDDVILIESSLRVRVAYDPARGCLELIHLAQRRA